MHVASLALRYAIWEIIIRAELEPRRLINSRVGEDMLNKKVHYFNAENKRWYGYWKYFWYGDYTFNVLSIACAWEVK